VKFFNNIYKNNLSWFTFVELIVSMVISSILLLSIFYFISANIEDIFLSNKKTWIYSSINDFRNEILPISSVYNSWTVIVNNPFWSWSDILLLTSKIKNDGYLVWVIKNTKLELLYSDYIKYNNKSIWYTRISSWEIANIYANTWSLSTIIFNNDHIFSPLKIKDFHVDLYNSWSIINLEFSLLQNYSSNFDDIIWSDSRLKWTNFFKINLDF
jgi:hypothetical protein